MEVALGIAVLALIGLLLFVRRPDSKPKPVKDKTVGQIRKEVAKKSTPYHAVSIKFGDNACQAAKDMVGKRFLSGAAPRLPLPDCNVLECKCRFLHHTDRRAGSDRRSQFRGGIGIAGETGKFDTERRSRPERRADDDEDEDFF